MFSLCRLPVAKYHNLGQILTFGGSFTDPLSPKRSKLGVLQQTYAVRLCAKFRLHRFVISPSGGENPQILPFWTSAFCGVARWRQSEKVEFTFTFAICCRRPSAVSDARAPYLASGRPFVKRFAQYYPTVVLSSLLRCCIVAKRLDGSR